MPSCDLVFSTCFITAVTASMQGKATRRHCHHMSLDDVMNGEWVGFALPLLGRVMPCRHPLPNHGLARFRQSRIRLNIGQNAIGLHSGLELK